MKDRRFAIVLASGVLIAVVSLVRVISNHPQDFAAQIAAATERRPAPNFEGLDAENRLVRLSAWLGRHRIVVVFFDGEQGADQSADVLRLRERFVELQAHDIKVVGVTAAIPQHNRAAMERAGGLFPFPVVSDVDPQSSEGLLKIHRQWERLDAVTQKPLNGLFFVDRQGLVEFVGAIPKSYDNVDQLFANLSN